MSYETTIKSSVANTAAAITEIRTRMLAMGWTEEDDRSSESPPYRIFKSTGEDGSGCPCYLKLKWNDTTDIISFEIYSYWNSTSHSGTARLNATVTLGVDDDSSFFLWVYGNKDKVVLFTLIGSTYDTISVHRLEKIYVAEGTLSSAVSAGSNVVLSLGTGEGSDFVEGADYVICGSGSGEGFETGLTVSNVSANQITVDTLARGHSANSVIAFFPNRWSLSNDASRVYVYNGAGTGDITNGDARPQWISTSGAIDPSTVTGMYDLVTICHDHSGQVGHFDRHLLASAIPTTSNENTVSVFDKDSGTASSGTTSTLVDSSKSWTADEFNGDAVIIKSGTGLGQIRDITDTTGTTITVTPNWDTTPDSTSAYVICKRAYRQFVATHSYGGSPYSICLFEAGVE